MQRAGRFWKLISIAVGALAAILVVSVGVGSRGSDASMQRFVVPNGYTGVVWVGVPSSDETVSIHIEWGAWAIDQTIGPDDPRTWRFDRVLRDADEPTLPIFVTATPKVTVEFGYDSLPPGTRGLPKENWYPLGNTSS